jgi:hypothetical protein
MPSVWGMTPQRSIELECSRRGKAAVVDGCIAILRGDAGDDSLIVALGGPAAHGVLDGREGGRGGYWPRVWAVRGLLHAWDPKAATAVVAAIDDASWRVREMAAKVVAAHRVDAALDAVVALKEDPVPRVRSAAERALRELTAPH